MSNYKIVFTGPVGAGKTTAIASISHSDPVKTDAIASDLTKHRKARTTVAMDFGVIKLEDGEQIHLYGTPGQQRFDFMWEILTTGGIGLVLLIDNTREDPLQDLEFFLTAFNQYIKKTSIAIGITRTDLSDELKVDDYRLHLKKLDLTPPIFEVDARESKDVSMLVQSLLYTLDPEIDD